MYILDDFSPNVLISNSLLSLLLLELSCLAKTFGYDCA